MPNSTTKRVGDHSGKKIENCIDKNELKSSHMPFHRSSVHAGPSPQIKLHACSVGNQAQVARFIKTSSTQANVPFSATARFRSDDAPHFRTQSVQMNQFTWKSPTVYK